MTDIYVPEGYVLMPIEPTPHMLDVLGTTANNSWNRAEWYANLINARPPVLVQPPVQAQ